MCRRFAPLVALAACLVWSAATSARAAEDLLKLVPDSALGFAVINRPAAVDGKLQQLQRQVGAPLTSVLAKLKEAMGAGEGLDEQGALGILALPPEGQDAEPRIVVLVPVTDYKKFLEPLTPEDAGGGLNKITIHGKQFLARHVGGYAAVADARLRNDLEKNLKVAAEVPAGLVPWQKWLAANDADLVILQPGVKLLSGKVQSAIGTMKSTLAMAGEQGKAAAAGLDLYVKFFQFTEKEVAVFGLGARLDRQGTLRLASRTRAIPGGQLAKMTADVKPAKEDLLTGLPAGPFAAAGGGTLSGAGWADLMRLSLAMMKATRDIYGVSEEQLRKMQALPMDWMKSARSFSAVLGAGEGKEPMYSRMIVLIRADNAQTFLADYEKYLKQYAEIAKGGSSLVLPAMTMEKTKVGGAEALQLSMQMKAPPGMANAQQIDRMMEAMFGPGGKIVAWLAVADPHTLAVGYTNKARLEQAIQAIRQGKPGLSAQADVAKTAALLPKAAPLVVYLSPRGMLEFFQRFIAAVAPPEAQAKIKFPEFPKTPPVGLAVSAAPNEIRTQLVVPPEVLQGIGQVVKKPKHAED